MSSIWKDDRSPFFTACFTAYVGQQAKQLKKSTATDDRELAKDIAVELERAGAGQRTAEQAKEFLKGIGDLKAQRAARRAFDDVFRLTTGTGLESRTMRSYAHEWLERTRGELAPGTWGRYKAVITSFLKVLEGKADQDIATVRQEDIARFRDAEAKRVQPATANLGLKILRILFNAAESSRVVTRNEAKHVQLLKRRGKRVTRRAFTLDELKDILAACGEEWRSLVLFGFYTGARLGDLAALTWQNVDLAQGELRYESAKTGRRVHVPLATPLRKHIEGMPAGDDPKQPLHPNAFEIVSRQGRVGMLSNAFQEILVTAGLSKERTHKADKDGKGRAGKRKASEVSFHALRHSAVTMLKLAGVGEAVAMDLVGHDSAEISQHYTHIDHGTKLDAVNRLPLITTPKAAPQDDGKKGSK